MANRIGEIGKTLFILFVMLFASAFLVYQAGAAVGVKAGDWVKYTAFDVTFNLPEGSTAPPGFEEVEDVEWVKIIVESVSGNTITLKNVYHYKNGTDWEGVHSGEVGTHEHAGVIVEANLAEGDSVAIPLFGGPEGPTMTINGTESRKYAGASREVNYIRMSFSEADVTFDLEAYWDKLTGVLCEMSMSVSGDYEGEAYGFSIDFRMTETNMWEAAPGFLGLDWWIWIVIIIVIGGVVVGAIVVMQRRKPSEEQALQPTMRAQSLNPLAKHNFIENQAR